LVKRASHKLLITESSAASRQFHTVAKQLDGLVTVFQSHSAVFICKTSEPRRE